MKAASRSLWYSASGSVCCGATVHESPVWTPIGSRFSIEQTTTQLPARSAITSSSNSCQPLDRPLDESLADRARLETVRQARPRSSSSVRARPPPWPPERERRPDDRRREAGRQLVEPSARRRSPARQVRPRASRRGTPAGPRPVGSRRGRRRSARPRSASRTPASASSTARLSAVWPPSVGRSASGRSFSTIAASASASRGSRYVASAH